MEEYQSTQVPMRSKMIALGTAGDVDTADMLMYVSVQVRNWAQHLPVSSRDMVGQVFSIAVFL